MKVTKGDIVWVTLFEGEEPVEATVWVLLSEQIIVVTRTGHQMFLFNRDEGVTWTTQRPAK